LFDDPPGNTKYNHEIQTNDYPIERLKRIHLRTLSNFLAIQDEDIYQSAAFLAVLDQSKEFVCINDSLIK